MSGLRHISEFLVCPIILECGEDTASCDCAYHENMRAAEATHQDSELVCYECGFPADVQLINWYCSICYAGLKEVHAEN